MRRRSPASELSGLERAGNAVEGGGLPRFGSTRVSKNAARTIQIPDSALRPGFWELSSDSKNRLRPPRFQIPRLAPDLGS